MKSYSISPLGDQAVTFSLGAATMINHKKVLAMRRWLSDHQFPGLLDIVISYSSVTILYDAYALKSQMTAASCRGLVTALLEQAFEQADGRETTHKAKLHRIPVCYEAEHAPDMDLVCSQKGLSRDQVISLHTAKIYPVFAIGFLPGFPYLADVDPRLQVARRSIPRSRVPGGSVGLAGVQTGIYPVDSPGGWQIIGRTPLALFDKDRDPPVLLETGDEVAFQPVTAEQFRMLLHRPS